MEQEMNGVLWIATCTICSTSQFVAGQELTWKSVSFEHPRLKEMRSIDNLRCDKLSITFVVW